jgi:hypothetical protein
MFECPVCYYPKLKENPHHATYEICPQCGIEFGYQDSGPKGQQYYWKILREKWIAAGCPWWSKVRKAPPKRY